MKFKQVLEAVQQPIIQNPTLGAYLAQINDLNNQLKMAQPQQQVAIRNQIQDLSNKMNMLKQQKQQQLKQQQQALNKANQTGPVAQASGVASPVA